jgi:hypothetical protein
METLETAGAETLRQWVRDWFEWAEKVEASPSTEEQRWHGMCERLEGVFQTCESESRLAKESRDQYIQSRRDQEQARMNYLNQQSELTRTSERQLVTARTTMKKVALSADASFRYLAFEEAWRVKCEQAWCDEGFYRTVRKLQLWEEMERASEGDERIRELVEYWQNRGSAWGAGGSGGIDEFDDDEDCECGDSACGICYPE